MNGVGYEYTGANSAALELAALVEGEAYVVVSAAGGEGCHGGGVLAV